MLQKPATRRVEEDVALDRSETLELGSNCVENSGVEWRALGNVRWVRGRDLSSLRIRDARQKCVLDV